MPNRTSTKIKLKKGKGASARILPSSSSMVTRSQKAQMKNDESIDQGKGEVQIYSEEAQVDETQLYINEDQVNGAQDDENQETGKAQAPTDTNKK